MIKEADDNSNNSFNFFFLGSFLSQVQDVNVRDNSTF